MISEGVFQMTGMLATVAVALSSASSLPSSSVSLRASSERILAQNVTARWSSAKEFKERSISVMLDAEDKQSKDEAFCICTGVGITLSVVADAGALTGKERLVGVDTDTGVCAATAVNLAVDSWSLATEATTERSF